MPDEESLRTSTLDPNLETKILIHGYTVRLDPGDIRFVSSFLFFIVVTLFKFKNAKKSAKNEKIK